MLAVDMPPHLHKGPDMFSNLLIFILLLIRLQGQDHLEILEGDCYKPVTGLTSLAEGTSG